MHTRSRFRPILATAAWLGLSVPVTLLAAPPVLGPLGDELHLSESGGVKVFSPAAAFTSDGGLVVVWESQLGGIMSRRLDRDGRPAAAPVQLAGNDLPAFEQFPYKGPATTREAPAIVALADGGVLVAWTEKRLDVEMAIYQDQRRLVGSRIFAQRFDRAGKAVGKPAAVGGALGLESEPQVARLTGGDLLVAWQVEGGAHDGIYARALSGSLVPRGEPFRVDDLEGRAGAEPTVAAGPADGFLVAWQSCCDGGGDDGIFARRFAAPGKAAAASFPVNGTTAGAQSLPVAVAGTGGGYLVAWLSPASGSSREIEAFARPIGANGEPSGGDQALGGGLGRQPTRPGLVAGPAGYLVAWSTGVGRGKGDFVRRLDASGAPSAEAVQVSVQPPNYERRVALAWDGGKRYAVAWGGFDPAGRPSVNARMVAEEEPQK